MGNRVLKINTVLSLDGFRVCLAGKSSGGRTIGLSAQVPFVSDYETEHYIKRLRSLSEKLKGKINYAYDPAADKVTSEENIWLYDQYIDKMGNPLFRKHPTNPLSVLVEGREAFLVLTPLEQMEVLLNIHVFFGRSTQGTDLCKINGVAHSAVPVLSSTLSNWKKRYSDIRIIDQSASGLWETRSRNLLELL